MEKKKIYVIFTVSITTIGGAQMYTAGKAKYLEELGWEVHCFSQDQKAEKAAIPFLEKYVAEGIGCNFFRILPYRIKRFEQEQIINHMIQKIIGRQINNPSELNNYEIIIESSCYCRPYWAELIASRIGARHFIVFVEELKEPVHWLYTDNRDFFYFKWKRNEFVTRNNPIFFKLLFNGYKNVRGLQYDMPQTCVEMHPIQDVDFPIEKVQKLDWNICHVGRAMKDYVPYVIEGVAQLAKRYPSKKINFIFVGNAQSRMELIKKHFQGLGNVAFTFLGDMVPIPRILFSKVDVVCAISQSARFCANEDVLTICASAQYPNKTPGVLGYDTDQQVYGEGKFSYVEALENVLVKKLYANKKYKLEKLLPAEHYYENFWTIVKKADPKKEYYVERLSQERIRNWSAIFPFGIIARGAKIILFGENDISKDYRAQIMAQRDSQMEIGADYIKQLKPKTYCEVVATVDEHPENFDDSVVGIERLKNIDYDAIVLCAFPNQAQAAYNKIIQIVPNMANRVVYNFQVNQT